MRGGDRSTGVTYQIQTCIVTDANDCDATAAVDNNGWIAGAAGTGGGMNGATPDTIVAPSDNRFLVRVAATMGASTLHSEPFAVGAINVQPSNAVATRMINPEPDSLVVTWDGNRSSSTAARIILGFTSSGTTTWVSFSTVDFTDVANYAAGGDDDPDHTWRMQIVAPVGSLQVVNPETGVPIDDDADTGIDESMLEVTLTMLNGKFEVRVHARQPGVDETPAGVATWKTSRSDTVEEK